MSSGPAGVNPPSPEAVRNISSKTLVTNSVMPFPFKVTAFQYLHWADLQVTRIQVLGKQRQHS